MLFWVMSFSYTPTCRNDRKMLKRKLNFVIISSANERNNKKMLKKKLIVCKKKIDLTKINLIYNIQRNRNNHFVQFGLKPINENTFGNF